MDIQIRMNMVKVYINFAKAKIIGQVMVIVRALDNVKVKVNVNINAKVRQDINPNYIIPNMIVIHLVISM